MSDINGPNTPDSARPVEPVVERRGTADGRSPDSGPNNQQRTPENREAAQRVRNQARGPAVSIAATTAHIERGNRIEARITGTDSSDRPVFQTQQASFSLRPDVGLEPGDTIELVVTGTEHRLTANLISRNGVAQIPPPELVLTVTNLTATTPESQVAANIPSLASTAAPNSTPLTPTATSTTRENLPAAGDDFDAIEADARSALRTSESLAASVSQTGLSQTSAQAQVADIQAAQVPARVTQAASQSTATTQATSATSEQTTAPNTPQTQPQAQLPPSQTNAPAPSRASTDITETSPQAALARPSVSNTRQAATVEASHPTAQVPNPEPRAPNDPILPQPEQVIFPQTTPQTQTSPRPPAARQEAVQTQTASQVQTASQAQAPTQSTPPLEAQAQSGQPATQPRPQPTLPPQASAQGATPSEAAQAPLTSHAQNVEAARLAALSALDTFARERAGRGLLAFSEEGEIVELIPINAAEAQVVQALSATLHSDQGAATPPPARTPAPANAPPTTRTALPNTAQVHLEAQPQNDRRPATASPPSPQREEASTAALQARESLGPNITPAQAREPATERASPPETEPVNVEERQQALTYPTPATVLSVTAYVDEQTAQTAQASNNTSQAPPQTQRQSEQNPKTREEARFTAGTTVSTETVFSPTTIGNTQTALSTPPPQAVQAVERVQPPAAGTSPSTPGQAGRAPNAEASIVDTRERRGLSRITTSAGAYVVPERAQELRRADAVLIRPVSAVEASKSLADDLQRLPAQPAIYPAFIRSEGQVPQAVSVQFTSLAETLPQREDFTPRASGASLLSRAQLEQALRDPLAILDPVPPPASSVDVAPPPQALDSTAPASTAPAPALTPTQPSPAQSEQASLLASLAHTTALGESSLSQLLSETLTSSVSGSTSALNPSALLQQTATTTSTQSLESLALSAGEARARLGTTSLGPSLGAPGQSAVRGTNALNNAATTANQFAPTGAPQAEGSQTLSNLVAPAPEQTAPGLFGAEQRTGSSVYSEQDKTALLKNSALVNSTQASAADTAARGGLGAGGASAATNAAFSNRQNAAGQLGQGGTAQTFSAGGAFSGLSAFSGSSAFSGPGPVERISQTTVLSVERGGQFPSALGPAEQVYINTPLGQISTTLPLGEAPQVGSSLLVGYSVPTLVASLAFNHSLIAPVAEALASGLESLPNLAVSDLISQGPVQWPAFEAASAVLSAYIPADGAATTGSAPSLLASHTATGGNSFANLFLFFMAAVQGGTQGPSQWLTPKARTSLERQSPGLARTLLSDLDTLFKASREPAKPSDWRSFQIPFDVRDGEMHFVSLLVRRDPQNSEGGNQPDKQNTKEDTPTHFLLDVSFSAFGATQIDGRLYPHGIKRQPTSTSASTSSPNTPHLDLKVTTSAALPGALRADVETLFHSSLSAGGMTGRIQLGQNAVPPVDTEAIRRESFQSAR